jgi:hypothetical protein
MPLWKWGGCKGHQGVLPYYRVWMRMDGRWVIKGKWGEKIKKEKSCVIILNGASSKKQLCPVHIVYTRRAASSSFRWKRENEREMLHAEMWMVFNSSITFAPWHEWSRSLNKLYPCTCVCVLERECVCIVNIDLATTKRRARTNGRVTDRGNGRQEVEWRNLALFPPPITRFSE